MRTRMDLNKEFSQMVGRKVNGTKILAYSGSSRCRRRAMRRDRRAMAKIVTEYGFGTPRANGTEVRVIMIGHAVACIDPDCAQTTGHTEDCALDMTEFREDPGQVEVK